MTDTLEQKVGTLVPAAGSLVVDKSHSNVEFTTKHLMFAKVRGGFDDWDAELHVGEQPEESTLNVEFKASSINTHEAQRDGHLVGEDFLDSEKWPVLRYEAKRFERAGDKWVAKGVFTVKDVSKPLDVEVEYLGEQKDPWGNDKQIFEAHTEFDRRDWGLTWNQALETGGVLVGNVVKIDVSLEASRG